MVHDGMGITPDISSVLL